MELVVGTRNSHKIVELSRILNPLLPGVLLTPASGVGPVEDGVSFVENALIKARAAYEDSKKPSIADDSGLEVDALEGRPGIFSARYAPSGVDSDNTALVLEQMIDQDNRGASFVCAAALVHDGGEFVVEARWAGQLAHAPNGQGGFGYDPIFIPLGETRTSAELESAEKDQVSHRGQAFRSLAAEIGRLGLM